MGKEQHEGDITWQTREKFYEMLEEEQVDAALVENVPEYLEKHARGQLSEKWQVLSEVVDPRLFGQGAARPRRYMIVYRTDRVAWVSGMDLKEILTCFMSTPTLKAGDYFWKKLPPMTLTPSQEKNITISSGHMSMCKSN